MDKKDIILLGDVHGEFDALKRKITHLDLKYSTLICVGDLGIGFCHPMKDMAMIQDLNDFFKARNIDFLSIRGNHDDPKYFNDEKYRIVKSNFELIADYTIREINGQVFQFIGGAISVDRLKRIEGIDYWKDEVVIYDLDRVQKCDVLVTHSAPTWNGPFDKAGVSSFANLDVDITLWDECVTERRYIDSVIKKSEAIRHYCGHFHQYCVCDFYACTSCILDILDFKYHRSA